MNTALIQAWATAVSTVLAAATGATIGIIHAIAVYRGKVQPTPNSTNGTEG
jgi:hypothetical protein